MVYDPSEKSEIIQNNIYFWIEKINENNGWVIDNKFLWIVANNKLDAPITEKAEKNKANLERVFEKINKKAPTKIYVINNLKNNEMKDVNVSLY